MRLAGCLPLGATLCEAGLRAGIALHVVLLEAVTLSVRFSLGSFVFLFA